jgi:hypothetical protein
LYFVNLENDSRVLVIDKQGTTVMDQELVEPFMNIEELPEGIYILKVAIIRNGFEVIRIVKQKLGCMISTPFTTDNLNHLLTHETFLSIEFDTQ